VALMVLLLRRILMVRPICEFHPCHKSMSDSFSCELCYCPEYFKSECSGTPKTIIGLDGVTKIKDCSDCTVNHTAEYITKHYKGIRG